MSNPIMARLAEPVDAAGLAVFRIAFGTVLAVNALVDLAAGRIGETYLDTEIRFTYLGFGWVEPIPQLQAVFALSAFSAFCVALGFLHRFTAPVLCACRTYVFLLERTEYLNHEYLICLLTLLLALSPAQTAWSVDARLAGRASRAIPRVWVAAFLSMQAIVYLHAGVAKLNHDWLRGEPIRTWLAERTDTFLVGPLLDQPAAAWVFAYGGIAFDLLVVPMLVCARTRPIAAAWAVAFHGLNKLLFSIGTFPWIMLAAMTLFFAPDWPRRAFSRTPAARATPRESTKTPGALALGLLIVFFAVQAVLPLRHLLYPGSVHWTEEGHEFSWHMKLRDKEGRLRFRVVDRSGREFLHRPASVCTRRQMKAMAGRPDLIHEYALWLRDEFARRGLDDVRVFADAQASLNGRPQQVLIDPTVDLASERRSVRPSPWIVPLTTPLR